MSKQCRCWKQGFLLQEIGKIGSRKGKEESCVSGFELMISVWTNRYEFMKSYFWEKMGPNVSLSEPGQSSPVSYSILSVTWLQHSEWMTAPSWRSLPGYTKGATGCVSDWWMALIGPWSLTEEHEFSSRPLAQESEGAWVSSGRVLWHLQRNSCISCSSRCLKQLSVWAGVLGHETRVF